MKDKVFGFLSGLAVMVVAFFGILSINSCCSDMEAAPVPLPRPKKVERKTDPIYPLGDWVLVWASAKWYYTFYLDGTCFGRMDSYASGVGYSGRWRYAPSTGLVVTEAFVRPDGPGSISWEWMLKDGEARWLSDGRLACKTKLERIK